MVMQAVAALEDGLLAVAVVLMVLVATVAVDLVHIGQQQVAVEVVVLGLLLPDLQEMLILAVAAAVVFLQADNRDLEVPVRQVS